jgi:hyperosmotically inducible protein
MQDKRQFGVAFWVAAAAIGLAACGERMESGQAPDGSPARSAQNDRPMDSNRPMDSTRDPSATAPMPGETPGRQADAALSEAVKNQLARDPQLGAAPIEVEVATGGQVALKGAAPTPAARERAAQLAMGVRGVTRVDNQLTVVGS